MYLWHNIRIVHVYLWQNIRIVHVYLWHNIRTVHEYEVGVEKFILRITIWHYKACRVMTNGDPEAWISLSHQISIKKILLYHPNSNDGYIFLLTIQFLIFSFRI